MQTYSNAVTWKTKLFLAVFRQETADIWDLETETYLAAVTFFTNNMKRS